MDMVSLLIFQVKNIQFILYFKTNINNLQYVLIIIKFEYLKIIIIKLIIKRQITNNYLSYL